MENELTDIPSDGTKLEDIIVEEEKETPAESPTEKKPKEKEEKEKAPAKENKKTEEAPFHEHPRFKELVEEKNQYKKDLDKMREEFESKISEVKDSQPKTTKAPAWFTELYGDNEEAWTKYQEHDKLRRDELKKEIREEFKKEQIKKDESVGKWDKWISNEIANLREGGLKFKKNDLMKVMNDYKPTDDKGNLDFKKGYKIMTLLGKKDPAKSKARKELVNEGKSKAEPESKKWLTPKDLIGTGW